MARARKADDPKAGLRDSWCTPVPLWQRGLRVFRIDRYDLDPCSNEWTTVPAVERRFQDGREPDDLDPRAWVGGVLLNCPFSATGPWLERAIRETGTDCSVLSITLCDPSVAWYAHVWSSAVICQPSRRVNFDPPAGLDATSFDRPITIALYTDSIAERQRFCREFRDVGPIITQWRI